DVDGALILHRQILENNRTWLRHKKCRIYLGHKEHIMSSRVMIDEFLSRRAMALFGMSRSGKKFGNYAYRALVAKGYRVYPVHPTASSIDGIRCYSEVAHIPEHIETALIVLPPAQAIQALRKAAT